MDFLLLCTIGKVASIDPGKDVDLMTEQRISAGGIVIQDGKVLLVHHIREGKYDFWVMPGGGIRDDEGIFRAAEREVYEETDLVVSADRIAYIEELIDEGRYVCKFWVVCRLLSGEISIDRKDADEDFLVEAKFFSQAEIQGMNVFPTVLKDAFWQDLQAGFPRITHLGYALGKDMPGSA
jgi:8-oxo-dGTP diphosphatase